MKEFFQFIGEVCVTLFGANLLFITGRMSLKWQAVGFAIMVVGGTGLLHHFTEESPLSDEWLVSKDSKGMICMTRRKKN